MHLCFNAEQLKSGSIAEIGKKPRESRDAPHSKAQIASQAECAEHYRELAGETLARSENAVSVDARTQYLLLAAHWYERALECERRPLDNTG
jgi:hypothetical protein